MYSINFLNETFQLVSYTTIDGVFFGISFSLYFLCVQMFCRQYGKAAPAERKMILFSFIYNSLIVLAAGLELGANTRYIQLAYIDNGGTHGEPAEWENQSYIGFSALKFLFTLPSFIIGTQNPLWQLWRVWVIWAMSPYRFVVTIFGLMLTLAGLGLDIYIQFLPTATPINVLDLLGATLVALNVAYTILVTLLLVGRIIFVRRRHIRLMGASVESTNPYTNIIAMLIESYALDAAYSTASVISWAIATEGNPVEVYQIFTISADQVTVIAFLLVTYRVLLGKGWTPETGRELSTIQWNVGPPEDTTDQTASTEQKPGTLGLAASTEETGSVA